MKGSSPDTLTELFRSLQERLRPEDVADLIEPLVATQLDNKARGLLRHAAKRAIKNIGFTSMLQGFFRPVGMEKQMKAVQYLFKSQPHLNLSNQECADPIVVGQLLTRLCGAIRKTPGQSDFKANRLTHAQRREQGLTQSRRQYNKQFRLLVRMEAKRERLAREVRKRGFTLAGKSGLASQLPWEEFSSHTPTACFIAYYTARCNLRSEFTVSGQQKPYDEIADALFGLCEGDPKTNWFAIAHVYSAPEVLNHLSDEQKGELLGRWFALLQDVAGLLGEVWNASEFNRETMIVKRGNDSSTWNITVRAWNRAREAWMNLLYALGMEAVLDTVCPGKALGLMAADVAAWHRAIGGGLHPDTLVWRELPLPWEVLVKQGETPAAVCTRADVEEACRRHNLDPHKNGWTAPRPKKAPAPFRPTPELVHGVTVSNPYLAKVLREAGYFSGKTFKNDAALGKSHLN